MRTYLKKVFKKAKILYARKVNSNRKLSLPHGKKRVYHIHIRKSAGTSVNSAFWGLAGLSLKKIKRQTLVISKHLVFVRNSKVLIEQGDYFYANSHIPFWNLNLPNNTFTFSVFRDPYSRVLSLYKYYLWIRDTNPKQAIKVEPFYYNLVKQTGWLGNSFSEFLDNLPDKHLLNQLYMFSESYNVQEAINNVAKLDKVYFQDSFASAISDLSNSLMIDLEFKREREFIIKELQIKDEDKLKAMTMLEPEYKLYNYLKNKYE